MAAASFSLVRIKKGSSPTYSSNRASDLPATTAAAQTAIAGGPSELWGLTLTEAEVESGDFGTAISCSGGTGTNDNLYKIDAVRVKVYYTLAGGGNDLVLVGLPAARGVARGASRGVL